MPQKSVYLTYEEIPLWDEAKRISGNRISRLIVNFLKNHIQEEKERQDRAERELYEKLKAKFEPRT